MRSICSRAIFRFALNERSGSAAGTRETDPSGHADRRGEREPAVGGLTAGMIKKLNK